MALTDRQPRPPVVLVAIEHEWTARSLDSILGPNGFAVLRARSGRQAIELARYSQPDAVVIDAGIPERDAVDTCRRLRSADVLGASTPIILTAAEQSGRGQRLEAYGAGAWLFCQQPLDGETLLLQLRTFIEAKRECDRAREESFVDDATGLYNIRGLARRAREIGADSVRRAAPLACIAFSPTLDRALSPTTQTDLSSQAAAALGDLCRRCGRISDAIGRLGVTEFAVVAPSTDAQGAVRLIERFRTEIEHVRGLPEEHGWTDIHAVYYAVTDFSASPIDAVEMLLRASSALEHVRGRDRSQRVRSYHELPPALA